jgi:ubiquinone/menaquinone biosynthesis C-methylase UbiE
MAEVSYVLRQGDSAADRLRKQDALYGHVTRTMMLDAGLTPGMRVLDLGCGMGLVANWLAKQVHPGGSVVGADLSADQLAVARSDWARDGLEGNRPPEFIEGSAYATGLPAESFDVVHCRFLLHHLERPLDALAEIYRLLKPGGVVVGMEPEVSNFFSYPPAEVVARVIRLTTEVGKVLRTDYDCGLRLATEMLATGFKPTAVRLIQETFLSGPYKGLWLESIREGSPAVAKMGIATVSELEEIQAEFAKVVDDETILLALPRHFAVTAIKP